jgi:hypothetical protein
VERDGALYVGIDPGREGGIAALSAAHQLRVWHMPATKRDISDLLVALAPGVVAVVLERQQSFPGQGVASTFALGRHYGLLEGLLTAYKLSFQDVPAYQWQKAMGVASAKGKTKVQHKNTLKGLAQQLFPHTALTLATCDAALIAEYAFRTR